jgi:hypothetical protein
MATKVRVCLLFSGVKQFYQRDKEEMREGRWTAVPYFTPEIEQGFVMNEESGVALVKRLRSLKEDPWMETTDGRRIDVPSDFSQGFVEDTRVPMRASLDDQNYFVVRPANTTEGPRWFIRCSVPGRPQQDIIYSTDVLGALQRAQDVGFLVYGERTTPPVTQQQAAPKILGPRKRIGDIT